MVEYANTLPTLCLEYAKAYPLLSLLPDNGDKTAAIDALSRTCQRRHDMAAEPNVGMTWAERLE